MGLVDIACKVSMVSIYVAMPIEGHMEQLYHTFSYLKLHHNSRLVLDPNYPENHISDFEEKDWSNFCG